VKTVYVLLRRRPDGRTARVGVWMRRATAERYKVKCERWAAGWQKPENRFTYEIIEEERL